MKPLQEARGTARTRSVPPIVQDYETTAGERITALARTFPAMRAKFEYAEANGLDPWNVRRLATASRPWSRSEKLIVSFLAHVWGGGSTIKTIAPFDVFDAQGIWDRSNWEAFKAWVDKPFFC